MIYILDNNPNLCASYLDDKSLDSQIKDIAQVLCNVHINVEAKKLSPGYNTYCLPADILDPKQHWNLNKSNKQWSQWARECKANYLYLVELGIACDLEQLYRVNVRDKIPKYRQVLDWARDNIPDLPYVCGLVGDNRPKLPLVMPKKYINQKVVCLSATIDSYRNFYQAKIDQHLKRYKTYDRLSWTDRKQPEWLEL